MQAHLDLISSAEGSLFPRFSDSYPARSGSTQIRRGEYSCSCQAIQWKSACIAVSARFSTQHFVNPPTHHHGIVYGLKVEVTKVFENAFEFIKTVVAHHHFPPTASTV